MNRREIGKSGILVSPLAVGCWPFGGGDYWGEQSQRAVDDIVAAALDRGVNLFDTAEMYNGGESERSLGLALKHRRGEAVICSKVSPDNAYYDELIAHCEKSLERLGTDYLDLYMLHWPINDRAIRHFTSDPRKLAAPPSVEEAFRALMKLKQDGKIRSIGVSNFGVDQMREALATGAQIDVNEMPYNIFSRAIEAEILPFCERENLSIICSMALQQGILTGLYASADEIPAPQTHSRHFRWDRADSISRHGGQGVEDEMFEALLSLKAYAADAGITLAQLAIAWTLHRPGVAATLVGSRTVEQLEENIRSVSLALPGDLVRKVNDASQIVLDRLGSNADYYESPENSRVW